jgi:hypothetical protein
MSLRFKVQLVVMDDDQEVCVDDVVVLDGSAKIKVLSCSPRAIASRNWLPSSPVSKRVIRLTY